MIGQEHYDVFSLGVAESVRARCSDNALDANNPSIIYVAMGLNVFMRCCRSFRCEGNYSPPTLTRICCLDLVREFTPQRLKYVQEEMARLKYLEEAIEPLSHLALALEILAAGDANLGEQVLRNLVYFAEEVTAKRVLELSAAATTVH